MCGCAPGLVWTVFPTSSRPPCGGGWEDSTTSWASQARSAEPCGRTCTSWRRQRDRTVFLEEVVESAEILTEEGDRRCVDLEYFQFGYDYSILHERDDIVLTATFRLEPTPAEELRRVIRDNLRWRDDRHPDLWLYPCAGSIFQKIEGIGAGRLIDECGLKGHCHGNAQIFHRHANIIVNLGGATSVEVRALIDLSRETVAREMGYELTPEIVFVGEF